MLYLFNLYFCINILFFLGLLLIGYGIITNMEFIERLFTPNGWLKVFFFIIA